MGFSAKLTQYQGEVRLIWESQYTMTLQPGIYRHYKDKLYQVIGVAKHSETEEEHVVYRPLYGARDLWIRPLSIFIETIEVEGKTVPRFAFVEE